MRITRNRTDVESALAEIRKVVRTAIRLKHSILAEREIYRELPRIENSLVQAIESGEQFEFEVAPLLQLPAGKS